MKGHSVCSIRRPLRGSMAAELRFGVVGLGIASTQILPKSKFGIKRGPKGPLVERSGGAVAGMKPVGVAE